MNRIRAIDLLRLLNVSKTLYIEDLEHSGECTLKEACIIIASELNLIIDYREASEAYDSLYGGQTYDEGTVLDTVNFLDGKLVEIILDK